MQRRLQRAVGRPLDLVEAEDGDGGLGGVEVQDAGLVAGAAQPLEGDTEALLRSLALELDREQAVVAGDARVQIVGRAAAVRASRVASS
ncbi:MAG: hypothetical protein IPG96_20550 [Proteobacteria bacterium]|nr:hypothetical protein [Pseudomonadota bacterium]